MSQSTARTLGDIAQAIGARLVGDPNQQVHSIAPITHAGSGQISFIDNSKYQKHLLTTQATAVIIHEAMLASCPVAALVAAKPYLAYARLTHYFAHAKIVKGNIHPTATLGENCEIDGTAVLNAGCIVGDRVQIGPQVFIGPHCVIGDDSKIGAHSYLHANVTLYTKTYLGSRVILQSGSVIGADGFGFAKDEQNKWVKIEHLAGVRIEDDVEIGANTTVDRGALIDTVIEQGVKLDNQVQVGHHVHIGEFTVIAGCTGIAGSTQIGKHCMIGGAVGIAGHINITDNVTITGMTMVTKSIKEAGVYSSGIPVQENSSWRRFISSLRQIAKMIQKLEILQQKVSQLEKKYDSTTID